LSSLFTPETDPQASPLAPLLLDSAGVALSAAALGERTALLPDCAEAITPKFVLLSSAAVSRPRWNEGVREAFGEAANIPIVQLNPDNILGAKYEGEQALRNSGVAYCVVRPCGLNEEQPDGRYVISGGDVATGRIGRQDLADFLVDMLAEPTAQGKTLEVFTLPGLPKRPLAPAIDALPPDGAEGSPAPEAGSYVILKQLSPGSGGGVVPSGTGRPN